MCRPTYVVITPRSGHSVRHSSTRLHSWVAWCDMLVTRLSRMRARRSLVTRSLPLTRTWPSCPCNATTWCDLAVAPRYLWMNPDLKAKPNNLTHAQAVASRTRKLWPANVQVRVHSNTLVHVLVRAPQDVVLTHHSMCSCGVTMFNLSKPLVEKTAANWTGTTKTQKKNFSLQRKFVFKLTWSGARTSRLFEWAVSGLSGNFVYPQPMVALKLSHFAELCFKTCDEVMVQPLFDECEWLVAQRVWRRVIWGQFMCCSTCCQHVCWELFVESAKRSRHAARDCHAGNMECCSLTSNHMSTHKLRN